MKINLPQKTKSFLSTLIAVSLGLASCGDDLPQSTESKRPMKTKNFLDKLEAQGIKVTDKLASQSTECAGRDCLE